MKTQALLEHRGGDTVADNCLQPSAGVRSLETRAKPFLKWAGGKSKLLSEILPHVPARFRDYHEPFLGSGAVFFAVRDRALGRCHLADLNEQLVNVWQIVRDEPQDLLDAVSVYMGCDTEVSYYQIRSDDPIGPLAKAARFVYLNQTAWNGLWRENKFGVFNVPWGARPFRGLDPALLEAVSSALGGTAVERIDFRESLGRAQAGDFVYLDPPYLPISDTSKFSGYNGKRFRLVDLVELASICEDLTRRGVHWMMSNRDNSQMRELFAHARVIPFTTWRSVSAQNRRNIQPSASPEVIVIGGPRP